MNRINPIHIVGVLIVVLIFFVVNLSMAKNELVQTKELYKETLKLSTQLSGLEKIYSGKSGAKRSIKRILNHALLKSANIDRKVGKSNIVLSSDSIDKTALNLLMSKLLNGSYNISSLKIKRLDDKTASLQMEIKW